MEVFMRAHHSLAVLAVLIVVLAVFIVVIGVKQLFFPPIKAEADLTPAPQMTVLQMHAQYAKIDNLPAQAIHDRTFVFVDGD
jgi:hypothetical protein